MIIISIDPSINSCGFAVFYDKTLASSSLIQPLSSSKEYFQKSVDISEAIKSRYNSLKSMGETKIIMEIPENWNIAGFVARETGSIFKLSFVCGMIYAINPDIITLVVPRKWKGQMSKDVVRNRLIIDYPDVDFTGLKHDVVDAIGIGSWYITKGHKTC